MSKKSKTKNNIPGPEEWQKMFAGMSKPKDAKYYKPNKDGWSKIFGDVDMVSTDIETENVEAEGAKKKYFTRFLTPMSGIMQTVSTVIEPEQRYEVGFKAATNSSAGFLASNVTFISDTGAPLGLPSSTGVKLDTLQTNTYTPVSFVTRPAPVGAAKAQLTFVVFGVDQEKIVDLDKVSFKKFQANKGAN